MKIHIIGGPGSGKSYLAKKLSEHFDIPLLELDQIHWDNSAEIYNTRRSDEERDAMLAEFLSQEKGVVEGIYYKWVQPSFEKADVIVVLQPSCFKRNFRMMKRFVFGKLGFGHTNENNLKALYDLMVWGNSYEEKKVPVIMEMTEAFADKRIVSASADEVFSQLTS